MMSDTTIRPEHVLITLVGSIITLGIPTVTFLWRIANSVSKLNFKVELLWDRFTKEFMKEDKK